MKRYAYKVIFVPFDERAQAMEEKVNVFSEQGFKIEHIIVRDDDIYIFMVSEYDED